MHLPVPKEFTLENGMKVLLVEDHTLPVLTAEVVARAGSDNNPSGKSGLASLTSVIMRDGTESRDLEKLAGDQERIGTTITSTSTMDAGTVAMTLLTTHVNEGMDLLADVAQHPAFRPDDVDRDRKQRLVSIAQETDNVQSMAMRVAPKLLFGDSPYGQSSNGTVESLTALTPSDISAFYKAHYGPGNSALVLVGDVTQADAEKVAKKYFGSWNNATAPPPEIPAPAAPAETHVVIVDKPGAPQTALFAIGLGVPENTPDREAITVMNYTLGGAFASRINMNLREVHGYTYGASSAFTGYRFGGRFIAGGLVRTDVTAAAAKEMMGEIRNFPAKPSTADELKAAKDASMRSLPGQFETTSNVAQALYSIFLYDRPLDFYANLPAKYSALTEADMARVAQQYLHPGQLIIVTAGDRSKIEAGLKDAGLGPVEVRDINGKLVTGHN